MRTAGKSLVWDIGDPEPEGVTSVSDYTHPADPEDHDSAEWGRTYQGEWKGYKNGDGVYMDWAELVRRWGPVTHDWDDDMTDDITVNERSIWPHVAAAVKAGKPITILGRRYVPDPAPVVPTGGLPDIDD